MRQRRLAADFNGTGPVPLASTHRQIPLTRTADACSVALVAFESNSYQFVTMATANQQPPRGVQSVTAPPRQKAAIAALATVLLELARGRQHARCELVTPNGERTAIPEAVFRLLEVATEVLARGDALAIVPLRTEQATLDELSQLSEEYSG